MKEKSCHIRKTSIGGQALIEGVMMRGPKKTAMTVRDPQGNLVVEEWVNKETKRPAICKLPFVRGVFNFIDSITFGYKCLMRSAEIAGLEEEDEKSKKTEEENMETSAQTENGKGKAKKEKKDGSMGFLLVISVILALAMALGLFVVLPTAISGFLAEGMKVLPVAVLEFLAERGVVFESGFLGKGIDFFKNQFVRAALEGVVRLLILVGYLSAVAVMKDIRRTYQYHGAEHKTIFCYESGMELTVENVRKQRRFHPRCGTSFLILMVIVGILVSMLIPTSIGAWVMPVWLRSVIKIALLPFIMGIGYELIKFAGRYDNFLTRIVSAPGVWLQNLTVFEPTDDMIECAIESMKRVIPEDGSDRW